MTMLSLKRAVKWAYRDYDPILGVGDEKVYRVTFHHPLTEDLQFLIDYYHDDDWVSFSIKGGE